MTKIEKIEWACRARRVVGFRVLVRAPHTNETTNGGIILINSTRSQQDKTTNWGKVMKMGPQCYLEEDYREPWCEVGDWVEFSTYESKNIFVYEQPCYYINDSQVLSVLEPEVLEKMLEGKE